MESLFRLGGSCWGNPVWPPFKMVLISSGCFRLHLGGSWMFQKMEILLPWATCPSVHPPSWWKEERNRSLLETHVFQLASFAFLLSDSEKAGPILAVGELWAAVTLTFLSSICMPCSIVRGGFAGQWQNSEKQKVLSFSIHLIHENSESLKRIFGCSVKCFN